MKKRTASKASAVTQPESNSTQEVEYVTRRVNLPPDLLMWAERYAYNLQESLSDLVRDCLEYEQFREKKPYYTTDPKGIRELEKLEREFAKR